MAIKPRLRSWARKLYERFLLSGNNDLGSRAVQYSFVAANIPEGPGKALDFGCGVSWMGLLAARKGYTTLALDQREIEPFYRHSNLSYARQDVLQESVWSEESYDLILNISVVEHAGLVRYGNSKIDRDADLKIMQYLQEILSQDGIMLLTVPVGKDALFPGNYKTYGPSRLPMLLEDWEVELEEYWAKRDWTHWEAVTQDQAFRVVPTDQFYGLGLFVLRKESV